MGSGSGIWFIGIGFIYYGGYPLIIYRDGYIWGAGLWMGEVINHPGDLIFNGTCYLFSPATRYWGENKSRFSIFSPYKNVCL